ncbi:dephospho-CoA kinase [Acidobacteriota bacterium]
MLIVSLTGGIATGKSVVSQILKDLGCYIHYSDLVAHQLLAPHKPAWKKILDRFGPTILKPDNTINRGKLGSIVFSNNEDRFFINELLHPLVFKEKEKEIIRLKNEGLYNIFVSEAALTVEAGYAHFFDKIIVTHCQINVQIKRLMKRDGINQTDALKRIESQMPSEQKLEYADYSIDTTGTLEETIDQSEQVFRVLMSDYKNLHGNSHDKKRKI